MRCADAIRNECSSVPSVSSISCQAEMMSPVSELDQFKRAAAETAVALISDEMIVGLDAGLAVSWKERCNGYEPG